MTTGQRVILPDNRIGVIVGWHGVDIAIVSVDDEVVEVYVRRLRAA